MKHTSWLDLGTLCVLVTCGVVARLALTYEFPNFAPVAGLALFAGFFLRDVRLAIVVPLAIMAISDAVIGPHHPIVMASVYACLALPVAAGPWLRNWLKLERPQVAQGIASAALIGSCSFAGACLFYVATNSAEWLVDCFRVSPTYSADLAGLIQCLAAGLPFFKYTLAGDLFFAGLFFGVYAAALNSGWLLEEEAAAA